jgi:hypothetical protein
VTPPASGIKPIAPPGNAPGSTPAPRLVIVAGHQHALYGAIKQALHGDDGVEVVVDRRVGTRPPVVAIPNRAVDLRETERVQEELLQRGWAVARRAAPRRRCPRCGSGVVAPVTPGPFGGLILAALGRRRYRCERCRQRFLDKAPAPVSSHPH